jgi:hypothetical protein
MLKYLVPLLLLTASSATAEDLKEGWGFQFRQDTFDKVTIPLSMMSQDGDGLDKSLIAVTCGADGKLVSFFQTGTISFDNSAKVQFRDGNSTKELTFSAGEIPHVGKRLMLNAKDTEAVLKIFENADGVDVPFRTGAKQGVFSSVAAGQTFKIVREHCIAASGTPNLPDDGGSTGSAGTGDGGG